MCKLPDIHYYSQGQKVPVLFLLRTSTGQNKLLIGRAPGRQAEAHDNSDVGRAGATHMTHVAQGTPCTGFYWQKPRLEGGQDFRWQQEF